MKKCIGKIFSIFAIMAFVLSIGISCGTNPMYNDVITESEYDAIIAREGITVLYAPAGEPIFMKFTESGIESADGSSTDWHIGSADTSWRMFSNSGTTAVEYSSNGTGGVKVYKDINFYDVTSINQEGSVVVNGLDGNGWKIDEVYDYDKDGSAQQLDLSLNYLLTKNVQNTTDTTASETCMYWFNMSGMMSGTGYNACPEYVFIVKDGTGGNYVKLQAVKITTDGSGMSYDNRIYYMKYQMANADGSFDSASDD